MSIERSRGRTAHDDVLTPAEWRVVEAVRHGLTNAIIASRLGVSADAVKFHVANALQSSALQAALNSGAGTVCAGTACCEEVRETWIRIFSSAASASFLER
ncbi:LuxR C-terminal-related transcriptional regulator [Sphingomonas aerophila]|uniref:DNA-binding CsgD family transcriptional regulator n=1 Tax=Sphingomonas aerophila TaxID=1344948 RepID=A0A7W9EU27_9SPHN|nr:DNA-binding CsgD family transcriptional regulator [Sphingomonas aerophila]